MKAPDEHLIDFNDRDEYITDMLCPICFKTGKKQYLFYVDMNHDMLENEYECPRCEIQQAQAWWMRDYSNTLKEISDV